MTSETKENRSAVYQTITGCRISTTKLNDVEFGLLEKVVKKYNIRQDWTRFAAWWNATFKASGLSTSSVVYRICQDLEARLGIKQGKVSPPDYRDYLIDLIDTHFESRQEFCRAAEIDPGQLSRVLSGRGDLSMKLLLKVLEMFHAKLVIQTDKETRMQTSVEQAVESLTSIVDQQKRLNSTPSAQPSAMSPQELISP
jgi:hypothetical protein